MSYQEVKLRIPPHQLHENLELPYSSALSLPRENFHVINGVYSVCLVLT
jgi:hypothetical protein